MICDATIFFSVTLSIDATRPVKLNFINLFNYILNDLLIKANRYIIFFMLDWRKEPGENHQH